MKLLNIALVGCSLVSAASAAAVFYPERDEFANAAQRYAPGGYIVELNDGEDIDTFLTDLRSLGLEVRGRRRLSSRYFHGLSFDVIGNNEPDHALMKRIALPAKTKNVWPIALHPGPDHTVVAASKGDAKQRLLKRQAGDTSTGFTHHIESQVDKLHEAGFTGKGIRIGIIDTAVDYNHPALGGCFGEGCLISYGADLVGNHHDFDNPPVEDGDPMDDGNCLGSNGHGTIVAGVVAGQPNEFGFVGVAPGATIGFYKICAGLPYPSDITVQALTRAAEDGSDVITFSVGLISTTRYDPAAAVANRIVESGIPVTIAASNAAIFGVSWTATSPCVGGLVTCVGATTPRNVPMLLLEGTYSVDDGPEQTYGRWNQIRNGLPVPPIPADFTENVTLPLWDVDTELGAIDLACQPLPDDTPDLSDRLVLVSQSDPWGFRDQSCPAAAQIPNLLAKGAKYIMIYQRKLSDQRLSRIPGIPEDIQWGYVPTPVGKAWHDAAAGGSNITVSIVAYDSATEYLDFVPNDDNPEAITTFSSWGPTAEIAVKPQVVAPGDYLLSTFPLDAGGYTIVGGTSFAGPFVAGLYALLMEARGTKDPKQLGSVLMSTAKRLNWFDSEEFFDVPAPVAQQGAGVVQGFDAYRATTSLDIQDFSFNDTVNFDAKHKFTIYNEGDEEVTYRVSHVKGPSWYSLAEDDGPALTPFNLKLLDAAPDLNFCKNEVTLGPGEKATISLKGTAPEGLDESRLPLYGGWVQVNGSNGESLSLPYVGLAGSMGAAPGILPGQASGTWFGTAGGTEEVEANTTFTLPRPSLSRVESYVNVTAGDPVYHVLTRTSPPILRIDIVSLDDEIDLPTEDFLGYKVVGQPIDLLGPFPVYFAPRTPFTARFNGLLWSSDIVPEGRYQIVVSALRFYGDESNKDDWDIVEFAPFNLQYKDE